MLPSTQPARASSEPAIGAVTSSDIGAVRALLTRLTVALNRRRAYAATHPMVAQAEGALHTALATLTKARGSITIGVAQPELLIDGVPLEDAGAMGRELAERLHRRGVGAITLQQGIPLVGLQATLAWLAHEPMVAASSPELSETAPAVPGIRVGRVAYDRLILGDDVDAGRQQVAALWRALAAAAFETELEGAFGGRSGGRGGSGSSSGSSGAGGGFGDSDTVGSGDDSVGGGGESARGTLPSRGRRAGEAAPPGLQTTPNPEADEAAEVVVAPEDDLAPGAEPEAIVEAIERRVQHEPYAKRVAFVLLTLTTQVTNAPPSVREELANRLRAVLQRISDSSLSSIVRAVGTGSEQRRFLSSIVSALPVSAVIEWLEVSARATDQELSHHLLRILAKLSAHASSDGADQRAQLSFREAAHNLVTWWQLADPNPIEHSQLLDHIAMFDPGADTESRDRDGDVPLRDGLLRDGPPGDGPCGDEPSRESPGSEAPSEAARLVQMACEIDVAGEDAVLAAEALVASGSAVLLFAWLARAPGARAAQTLRAAVQSSSSITAALLREPFDAPAARALLASTELTSAPAMLRALNESTSRAGRRMIFDRLREMGPALAPLVRQHLDAAPPWYFARNLLALLRDVTTEVSDSPTASRLAHFLSFLDHAHEQVRIEALRLLLEDRTTREPALRRALDDRSPRIVASAVGAAATIAAESDARNRSALSRDVAMRLLQLADDDTHDAELRARAIRALAGAPGPTVRDWLLAHVTRRTRVLRRVAIADARPTVIAALQLLAQGYASDARVAPVLALALEHHDARRDAVQRTTAPAEHGATPAPELQEAR